jgi:hypothetical protein
VLYRQVITMQEVGNATYRLAELQAPETAEKSLHLLSPSNE